MTTCSELLFSIAGNFLEDWHLKRLSEHALLPAMGARLCFLQPKCSRNSAVVLLLCRSLFGCGRLMSARCNAVVRDGGADCAVLL